LAVANHIRALIEPSVISSTLQVVHVVPAFAYQVIKGTLSLAHYSPPAIP